MSQEFSIARGHTTATWRKLHLDPDEHASEDWEQAVAMFRSRMEGRFFSPVQALVDGQTSCQQVHGFVVLAIDCLLMETLQGFRDGVKNHKGKSTELFKRFLENWPVFTSKLPKTKSASAWAHEVYSSCRCALLHSGCTDGFKVGISGDTFEFNDKTLRKINRTKLHAELKLVYEDYYQDLLRPDQSRLRANFRKKMDAICAIDTTADA